LILRSVTRHVRDQNWGAAGLDFLIVVTGRVSVGPWMAIAAFHHR